jgi:hypothetical protein
MKFKITVLAMIGIVVSLAGSAFVEAATSSANVTLHVAIASEATLSADTTEFPYNKTRRISGVSTQKSGAGVTANVRMGSSPATLTIVANKDSDTGTEIIPAPLVTATSADRTCYFSPDIPGTQSNKSSPETMGTQGCSGSYTETFDMYLAKSWKCKTGSQTITVTYTLTAP